MPKHPTTHPRVQDGGPCPTETTTPIGAGGVGGGMAGEVAGGVAGGVGRGLPGMGLPGTGLLMMGLPGTGLLMMGLLMMGLPGTGLLMMGLPGMGLPGTGLLMMGLPIMGLPIGLVPVPPMFKHKLICFICIWTAANLTMYASTLDIAILVCLLSCLANECRQGSISASSSGCGLSSLCCGVVLSLAGNRHKLGACYARFCVLA